jgi:hypothetical protein
MRAHLVDDDTLAPWSECEDCGMAWDEAHLSRCWCGLTLCADCREQHALCVPDALLKGRSAGDATE